MRTCKIIDTCTLINLFCDNNVDVSKVLRDYDAIVTDIIVEEYTRKYPRIVPDCIRVVNINDEDRLLMENLELLMPSIGPGERSAYAVMIRLSEQYDRVVLLTDDKKAMKKLKAYMVEDKLFRAPVSMVWADTNGFLEKLSSEGRIRN